MRFIIQAIETKTEQLLPRGSQTIYVFNFLQVDIRLVSDINPTTEVMLKSDDPRIEEWMQAFHEKRYFELSINLV